MEVTAKAKFVKISPKKVKPLLHDLKNKSVVEVLSALKYSPHKAGELLYKLIASASSNASNNYNLKQDNLKIKKITADEGPRFKRRWMRSRGSADMLLKRTAHLSVILEEISPILPSKTKATTTSPKKPESKEPDNISKASPTVLESKPKSVKPKRQLDIKKIFRRTTHK